MAKHKRKYTAPTDWKIGDTIYFKYDSASYWYEKVIVGETPRSWLLLRPGYSAYKADPTDWRWPTYCDKLPKYGYSVDQYGHADQWQFGSKRTMELARWVNKNCETIANELRWQTHKLDAYRLRNLAQDLGLYKMVAEYPEEGHDVKAANQSPATPAVENTDGDGGTKA